MGGKRVLFVLAANAALAAAPPSSLFAATPIAWYKLDETSGTVAADSSGSGNTATYVGTPTLGATAIRRFGVYFSGDGKYATAPASATLNALGTANADFTVTYWIKPNGMTGGWRPMFHKGNSDNERGPGIWLQPGNNRVHFRISTTSGYNEGSDSVAALPDAQWSHLAFVKAGNKWRCYVNGVLDTDYTLVGTTIGNNGPLYIGDDPWYAGCPAWMDDVRIYSSALTGAEIKALYGVVGHWKLDETSGITAADATNAGNNGTHTNGPVITPSGLVDGAVAFDGTDDYIGVPESASLVASDSVAVSAWIRPTATGAYDRMIVNKEGEYEVALVNNEIKWALANTSPGWAWHHTGIFVESGRWSHVVVSYDGVQVKTYLNGRLAETYSASGTIGDVNVSHNELRIGARSNPAGSFFAGQIDDVRVYTRAVSDAEVANLHGLVGHWKLDEASGTTLADATILGGHAAVSGGAPTWTSGMRSSALSFNGTSDQATTNQVFAPPSTGTVAFWFRSNGPAAFRQRLFGLSTNWEAWQDPDGIIRFDLCADGNVGGIHTVTALSTAGRWYHVAVTFDSATDAYAVYVDGVLVKSGISATALDAQASALLSFGVRTGTAERFAGLMDDFRVYNRRLALPEIYEVYGLVGWYKLNETSGNVAVDSTGLGRDGQYVGLPTLGAVSNGYASNATAVDFTGSNYMQALGLFDKSASVSICAWAKLDAADSAGADLVSVGDCFAIRLQNASPGVRTFYYNGSTWTFLSAGTSAMNTGWHHYAAVLDQLGTIKLYIDGYEAATAAAGAISYLGQGANTRIGSHGNGNTTYDLDGTVDEVQIYNRIMQPDEVLRVFNGSRVRGVRILSWVETRQ